ncbi:bifunctional diguanylate cyclase/phosphodiesterase [Rhizobium giardinii]|uniref:bifunctional diguanylate cyclase/phosphodiesterase n=1 Tax=Rhizobium giardinii TaxID=56731 RepID=UPI003D6F5CD5
MQRLAGMMPFCVSRLGEHATFQERGFQQLHRHVFSEGRRRQLQVVAVATVFVVVAAVLAGLVAGSINTLTATADAIDDRRARHAAAGALQSLRKQLGATVRDNAYWDDAFEQVNSDARVDWTVENWGSTTADYPLYDTAIVVDSRNVPVIAYRNGVPMEVPPAQFFGNFSALLKAARRAGPSDPVPVHFVHSSAGTALIGAAAIQPFEREPSMKPEDFYVLVFAKHITPAVVAEVSESFNIAGLSLDPYPVPGRLEAILTDVAGNKVAAFTWPSQAPGTKSYAMVASDLRAAGAVLVVFLCGIGIVGAVTVRSLKASERRARYRALRDPLTGLLNRAGLLESMIGISTEANSNTPVIKLHFIDLDGFKAVNDAWGHNVGDELIVAVAHRLMETLPENAIIARLGGDEFAVVTIENPCLPASDIGHRIQRGLSRIFEIGGRTIEIGASVGVATSPSGMIETGELIRRADIALYRAKDLGRGQTVDFEDSFDDDTNRQAALEAQLRTTLAAGDIDVAFQALFDAKSGSICGVEALARWITEGGDRIAPDVFIPLAERSGLIDQLGLQVLKKSLQAAASWPAIGLAVNVSPLQLKNPRFVKQVTDALEAADFDPRRLSIELTEGVLISDPEQARRAIDGLKAAGIKVALDDFGSGFASVGTLRQFGFDRMKVDRSLIATLDHDQNAGAVLHATIALANALDIPVTAEGIETEAQAEVLRVSGCDALQGYLFSRPISAEQFTEAYFNSKRDLGKGRSAA